LKQCNFPIKNKSLGGLLNPENKTEDRTSHTHFTIGRMCDDDVNIKLTTLMTLVKPHRFHCGRMIAISGINHSSSENTTTQQHVGHTWNSDRKKWDRARFERMIDGHDCVVRENTLFTLEDGLLFVRF
jgi:hypothetical protein